VWTNKWQKTFYDSVEHKAVAAFGGLVAIFIAMSLIQIGVKLIRHVIEYTLSIRWRRFLSDGYIDRWFARNRFYEIERLRLVDNPDQRIAEDITALTNVGGPGIGAGGHSPITIVVSTISSAVSAVLFASILLQVSRPIAFSAAGINVSLPGDLVWYAVIYVVLSTVAITWIGKPYVRRRMRQQHYEANFRSNLIHVRRNGEQIAFARAQSIEERGLWGGLDNIVRNWFQLMWANLGLNVGTGVSQRIGAVIPLFVMVPRYFTGEISFGDIMAGQGAFMTFTGMLSYFISAYPVIADQVANVNRIKALDDAIDHERPRGIEFEKSALPPAQSIVANDLRLNRPHGEPLLKVGDWTVSAGERWVIEGPSGAGKTTLLRAMSGLWPDGHGEVTMTDRGRAMLVPQRLYMPIGTLKDAVCFPARSDAYDDAIVAELLARVSLSVHVPTMHEVRYWQEVLSPGEQQRVALARVLLHSPDLLVLDEATSALDISNARRFHAVLLEAMPDLTLVSIVHNDKLQEYYTHRLRVVDGAAVMGPMEQAA
jgi:vitamin B12/bleomycin/antimicrobial peptide transport system ATP-binding/permease protein